MKQHIQELEAQLARERNSVNKESYYYNVTVSTKHRTNILCINAEPYYKHHTERRFNQAKYDQDVTVANNRIRNLESAINSLRQQEAEQARIEVIEQERQQKIAAERSRLAAIEQEKIAAEQARLAAIEQERQQKIAAEKARLEAVKHANDVISANISQQQKANYDMLQSSDSKQRAFFLSELFGKSDSESMLMISMIKSLGVDANELAYYAIKKTNNELFVLALNYGANCCDYQKRAKHYYNN
ncbi:MAG: hypothetical protein LN563_00490 [Rickettsia endosymbiont of Platyusa sonomae]|nr:hypothetical protein [Rickettsia endosymbiont of Platyusa sonomae]